MKNPRFGGRADQGCRRERRDQLRAVAAEEARLAAREALTSRPKMPARPIAAGAPRGASIEDVEQVEAAFALAEVVDVEADARRAGRHRAGEDELFRFLGGAGRSRVSAAATMVIVATVGAMNIALFLNEPR